MPISCQTMKFYYPFVYQCFKKYIQKYHSAEFCGTNSTNQPNCGFLWKAYKATILFVNLHILNHHYGKHL